MHSTCQEKKGGQKQPGDEAGDQVPKVACT
jgi:hypothetical protein